VDVEGRKNDSNFRVGKVQHGSHVVGVPMDLEQITMLTFSPPNTNCFWDRALVFIAGVAYKCIHLFCSDSTFHYLQD
jgi:hypothetical protein